MDDSSGRNVARAPPWNIPPLSTPPSSRRRMFSFGSSPPADGTNAADIPTSPRSPTTPSRRRRVFGRLGRSGSDPRSYSISNTPSDASDFLPEAVPRMPPKRKASSFCKTSKSSQRRSSMEPSFASNTDPPLLRSEDVLPSTQTPLPSNLFGPRTFLDSSDEDLDDFEVAMVQSMNATRPGRRFSIDLRSRLRAAEETRRRQDASRMLSAVLVTAELGAQDPHPPYGTNERLRYLPLCPSNITMSRSDTGNINLLTVLPSHCDFVDRLNRAAEPSTAVWPRHALPVELFDLITSHLARDDVKALRLVNREFEQKVSRSLFHTAVVPFNTEIYDMIDEERKTNSRSPPSFGRPKGKMRAMSQQFEEHGRLLESGGLQWENAKEDREGKVYKGHGLRVFRGFGPHIKRFGMSFEISEKQLSRPPVKKELDHIESYHGSYDWPSENYARFATLAGLENTADETSRMKAAFSHLEIVQELALSIDSGLGWLNGPDKSLRALIFDEPSPVFGKSYQIPDVTMQEASEFWTALQSSQAAFDSQSNLKEISLEYRPSLTPTNEIDGLRENIYSNTQLWSTVDSTRVSSILTNPLAASGVFYTVAGHQRVDENTKYPLMPGSLSKEQKEWLLETQWAQQAFLESYMLAVIDNPGTFSKVTTLNFANVSSRFLPMLAREGFWDRLPQLSEVILRVNADWRTVDKDDAGFAQTTSKFPSDAARIFHREILQERIAPRQSIQKLTIGWVGGGEHAEGLFARNNNILPAPITRVDHCTANSSVLGMVFPHVQHLILTNCWITPPTLEGLIKGHATKALRKLTLNSVSLTAHPKFPSTMHGAGAQHFAQAMVAMQAQLANHPAAPPQLQGANIAQPQLPPNANAQQMALFQQQMAQHWQQVQQQMHQQAQQVHQQAQQLQQMQQQVQQQMQQAQQGAGNQYLHALPPPALPVGAIAQPVAHAPTQNPPSHWALGHREGSWPELLDIISPGTNFNDYLPQPAPWEEQPAPRPETNLRTLEFKSCGYAKLLHHTGFDQVAIDSPRISQSNWFGLRRSNLKSSMMTTSDRNVGQIVQYIPPRELDALQFAWGLTEGWQDQAKAAEAEFDGYAPGGTGRFSGVMERGMALVGQPSTPGASSAVAL